MCCVCVCVCVCACASVRAHARVRACKSTQTHTMALSVLTHASRSMRYHLHAYTCPASTHMYTHTCNLRPACHWPYTGLCTCTHVCVCACAHAACSRTHLQTWPARCQSWRYVPAPASSNHRLHSKHSHRPRGEHQHSHSVEGALRAAPLRESQTRAQGVTLGDELGRAARSTHVYTCTWIRQSCWARRTFVPSSAARELCAEPTTMLHSLNTGPTRNACGPPHI